MKLLIINGPNTNLLGIREPQIYGYETYTRLCEKITEHCASKNIEVEIFQSNHEGAIVDAIQGAYGVFDGIVINACAYTHTSLAIADALKAVSIPTVEVHITDPDKREDFRRINYLRSVCKAVFKGFGTDGYLKAIDYLSGTL
ncbi:MAG: 3-dehydroquinate dehydratase [Lachnospiraceae bacterium]|nr:3-dehydroquinate dehydratase [Lachnospiraceae bacterium]